MAEPILTRIKHAWNVFNSREANDNYMASPSYGYISSTNPVYPHFSKGNDRNIVSSIFNRIALDVAQFDFSHVKTDENGRYIETIKDPLHNCLSVEANKDQTARALIQDICMSMFDEGCVAVVPIDTDINGLANGSFDIYSLRVGKILAWFPDYVTVELYNDRSGQREQIRVPKNYCAIIENPFYALMNEPNAMLKRLVRKLNLLDVVDEQSSSGKLDLIIQLPYVIKNESRKKDAEKRAKQIEDQLKGSKYGIAYTDGTERITQLNRPSENNLFTQAQYLTTMVYNQLGMTENIFNGKATELEIRNYFDRTIEPLVTAIIEEFRRKFLTKTARTLGHTIMGFRDTFRLVPVVELAAVADVFSRNEILTANELRQIIGMKPSDAPQADELRNKNMPIETQPNLARQLLDRKNIDEGDKDNE